MLKTLDDLEFYEQNAQLGEGAYSKVVKVFHKNFQRDYALKIIDVFKVSKQDCENLRNEIKMHKWFEHPNIIKFFDCIQIHNMVYILLEYAPNKTLFSYIHPQNGLPEILALRFLYQTSLGIKYLHDMNIAHRDLKPENLLLDDSFNIKICDFGWSCEIGQNQVRTTVCGTYEYMPPEIVNQKFHTNKVDIWCLGILLYEMIHGNAPFKAQSFEAIKKQINEEKILIQKLINEDTCDLLYSLLTPNFEDRYDIDSVLKHPAITKHLDEFERPLTKKEYDLLLTNFYYTQYRVNPEDLKRQYNLNNDNKQQKQRVTPSHLKEIHEKMIGINNIVEAQKKIPKKPRFSDGFSKKILKRLNDQDKYIMMNFANQNFLKPTLLQIAISARSQIHKSLQIILLERNCDYLKDLFIIEKQLQIQKPILFVIFFDSLLGGYKINAVQNENKQNYRKLIHKDFHGKSLVDLQKISELDDFVKCSLSGTFAITLSLFSAIIVAEKSLKNQLIFYDYNMQTKLSKILKQSFCQKWSLSLAQQDPQLYSLIKEEIKRQQQSIDLIASENYTSQSVLDCLGSPLQNKYSEGYPKKRYYGGNDVIDQIEILCQQRALETFRLDSEIWGVNVQALSGSPANIAAYAGVLQLGDKVMGLKLSHGGV